MLIRRVLARFAGFTIFTKIVNNVMKVVNRGKTGHIDSVKNVIGIGGVGFYCCGIFPNNIS